MTGFISFDNSLTEFVAFLVRSQRRPLIERRLFLRDPSGRLTFVVKPTDMDSETREQLSRQAVDVLMPYVDIEGFAVATADELFDDTLNEEYGWVQTVWVNEEPFEIRLIDRRVIGGDWLQEPAKIAEIPRILFASLKGGVGRSTALCVAAAELASAGQRVLVIDLDVEAPGLGSMLLQPDAYPRFGLLDYLVEASLRELDSSFYNDLTAPSWLTQGAGIVTVLPAIGNTSFENPNNVLSKLARAYISSDEADGITFRMQALLDRFSSTGDYDVILIDARAGLHETTGAAINGLGGTVFLFGIDQPQTFAAYSLLLRSLAIVGKETWLDRIRIVQAKAPTNHDAQVDFARRFRELAANAFDLSFDKPYQMDLASLRGVFDIEWIAGPSDDDEDAFNIMIQDEDYVPVTFVLESETFRQFDPVGSPGLLSSQAYEAVYGNFLRSVFDVVSPEIGLNHGK